MGKTSKFFALALSAVLAFALVACGNAAPADSGASEGEGGESTSVGMANPWSDVASAEEAADTAGVGYFTVPEGTEIALGPIKVEAWRAMEGLAEARVSFPAVDMTIRKGLKQDGEDVSGDYGTYAHEWTVDVDGFEVTCFGNRKGEATKTIWTSDNFAYSIVVLGLGGDTDFGLSADDVVTMVQGVQ